MGPWIVVYGLLAVATIALTLLGGSTRRSRRAPVTRSRTVGTRTERVEALIAGLADPAHGAWLAGAQAMGQAARRGDLTTAEVIALLEAVVDLAPLDERHDPQSQILCSLVQVEPDDSYVPILEAILPRLRPGAVGWATAMLVQRLPGVDAFLRLAKRDPAFAAIGLRRLSSRKVATSEAQRATILAMALNPALVDHVAGVALDWTMRAIVAPSALALRCDDFIRGYRAARARLAAARAARGEAKEDLATIVGVYLDLFGHLAPAAVASDLDAAAQDRDPAIAVFAVVSLRRGGRTPSPEVLDRVARHDRARWVLLQLLGADDQQAMIPPQWRTQEAFARVDLAYWLSFPSELGTWPDEMALMKVVSVDADGGAVLDMYVFKYRMLAPHQAATRGWMAGVAGPYLRGEPPRLGGANTFSSMEPAEARTAEEHAGRVAEILAEWRAAHGQR